MATNFEQISAIVEKGNQMNQYNTFKRVNSIPLDFSSVQGSFDAAVIYAATSPIAYIGQLISVTDTLYIITDESQGKILINDVEYDILLKAVGVKDTTDDESIITRPDGKLSLFGYVAAEDATLPQKQADGTLKWVTIESIVSQAINTSAIIQAAEGSYLTVDTNYDKETDTYTYTIDIEFPENPEYLVSKEIDTEAQTVIYKITKDNILVGEPIVVPIISELQQLVTDLEDDIAALTVTKADASRVTEIEALINSFFNSPENPDETLDNLTDIQKAFSDIVSRISTNEEVLAALTGTGETSINQAITTAVAEALLEQDAINSTKYASVEDLDDLDEKVDSAISEFTEALDTKLTTANLEEYLDTNEYTTVDKVKEVIGSLPNGDEIVDLADIEEELKKNTEAIATLTGDKDTKDSVDNKISNAFANAVFTCKYDTYKNWNSSEVDGLGANLVLLKGEIGFCEFDPTESTSSPGLAFKVGDGETAFKDLEWFSTEAADVFPWAKAQEVVVYQDKQTNTKKLQFKTGDEVIHQIDLSNLVDAADIKGFVDNLNDVTAKTVKLESSLLTDYVTLKLFTPTQKLAEDLNAVVLNGQNRNVHLRENITEIQADLASKAWELDLIKNLLNTISQKASLIETITNQLNNDCLKVVDTDVIFDCGSASELIAVTEQLA